MILFDSKNMLFSDGLQIKIISEPSQNEKYRSTDGSDSKYDELRIVLCYFADPTVGERGLMFIIL